jgi:hypothetical protein
MFGDYSAGSAMPWVRTMYHGNGCQAAILWNDGAHIFGPDVLWNANNETRPAAEWPINRAMRGLGVRAEGDNDEFKMFGLSRYRTYRDIVEEAEELVPPGE